MTVEDYDPLFEGLRDRLVPLLKRILEAKKTNPNSTLPEGLTFPVDKQEAFCTKVSQRMGFDFVAVVTGCINASIFSGYMAWRYSLYNPL